MTPPDALAVTISVRGRFHAFDLARQLQRRGALRRLITTYPKYKVREWDIPGCKVSSFVTHEILNRLVPHIPFPAARGACRVRLSIHFDQVAAKRIPDNTRLFVGWSSEAAASLRRAKVFGARTVVERGSTHICFQDRILAQEYDRAGFSWEGIPAETIARSLQEYAEADFISIPSAFVHKTFVQYGVPAKKLLVIPYGCDLSVFRPGPKLDDTFRVIHCGQVGIRKGIHVLVQAFAELNLPDSELWLIGGVTPEARKILKRYPNPNISLRGPFPQQSLPQLYSQGSVFCIASVEEGLAMVIPQAMACGLPVIATENSGAEELVQDGATGFIIPAADVDALKGKLLLLFEDRARLAHMAANVASRGAAEMSWNNYGDRIVHAYRKILDDAA